MILANFRKFGNFGEFREFWGIFGNFGNFLGISGIFGNFLGISRILGINSPILGPEKNPQIPIYVREFNLITLYKRFVVT